MALTRIISFAGPPFVAPPQAQPNIYFVGKYRASKFTSLLTLRQFHPFDSTLGPDLPYTVATNLSALGTIQTTAFGLTAQDNEVLTATTGVNEGVRITLVTPGIPTIVHNYSGTDIFIWPPVGGQINKIGVNVKYRISDGSSMEFKCTAPTQFYSTSP